MEAEEVVEAAEAAEAAEAEAKLRRHKKHVHMESEVEAATAFEALKDSFWPSSSSSCHPDHR